MKLIIAVISLPVVTILARLAWYRWPPLIRYLLKRNHRGMQNAVRRYLIGQRDLDSVATELARRMKWEESRGWAMSDGNGKEGGSLTAWVLRVTPTGFSSLDPRLVSLEERTFMLYWGPKRYGEIQERVRQMQRHRPDTPPLPQ